MSLYTRATCLRCVALSRAVAAMNAGTVCTRPITSKAKSTPSLRLLWRHTPRERGHFVRQCLKEILLKTGGQNVRAPASNNPSKSVLLKKISNNSTLPFPGWKRPFLTFPEQYGWTLQVVVCLVSNAGRVDSNTVRMGTSP